MASCTQRATLRTALATYDRDIFASNRCAAGAIPSSAVALPCVMHRRTVQLAGNSIETLFKLLVLNLRFLVYGNGLLVSMVSGSFTGLVSRAPDVGRPEGLEKVLVETVTVRLTAGDPHFIDIYC